MQRSMLLQEDRWNTLGMYYVEWTLWKDIAEYIAERNSKKADDAESDDCTVESARV